MTTDTVCNICHKIIRPRTESDWVSPCPGHETLADLRAQFEAGLRDDRCVSVPPQVGIALLDEIEALRWSA